MTYINVPPNLRDMFQGLTDRITRLELAPNGPQDTADIANATANAASATAVAAQTTATGAQTTANGKNTVHYSSSTPGSTANVAGDLWFQFDGSNNIIGQWTGQGGTSWQSNQITSTVIANLDAGKITTGTLNATLVTVTTSPSASNSITFSGANTSIDFKVSGSTIGHIVPLSSYGVLIHYGASADPGGGSYPQMYVGSSNVSMFADSSHGIGVSTSGASVNGGLTINTGTLASGTHNINSGTTILNSGGTIYANSLGTGTGLSVVQVQTGGNTGYLKVNTSARRFKKNITPIDSTGYLSIIDAVTPVTYDEIDGPDNAKLPGFIAEDLAEVKGMESVVVYNDKGEAMGIAYDKIPVMIMLALKELKQQINARLDKLEGK